jgi:hypothetical protein
MGDANTLSAMASVGTETIQQILFLILITSRLFHSGFVLYKNSIT